MTDKKTRRTRSRRPNHFGSKPGVPASGRTSPRGGIPANNPPESNVRRLASLSPIPHDAARVKTAPLPELLLPAGSPDALCAAIEAGADAVYFGASAFSARARAVNFTDSQAEDAIAKCRAYGVKAYAAVNTRIRDGEMDQALALAEMLYCAGVDAVIAADPGLCAEMRERFPDLELHASTQLTPASLWDARLLCRLGFSRMVAPRELSYGELCRLCGDSPIEIEAFVHGAHCVSLSGQCLMSSLIGGRSANRGECAQPCRLPYKMSGREGYLLSLADMCYGGDIPALIASGVRSLKIEGRQKDENYVYGVGRIYRALLDERRSATADEIASLAELFERGFTDGYLRRSFGEMCGVRLPDAARKTPFRGLTKKVPLSARLELHAHRPAKLILTAPGGTGCAQSDGAPGMAEGNALTEDRARAAIAKLGQTPFVLDKFEFDTDGETWIAASELNELRRRCAERLLSSCRRTAPDRDGAASAGATSSAEPAGFEAEPVLIGEFTSADQLCPEVFAYFDRIYLPYTEYDEDRHRPRGVGLSLPPYMTDETADALRAMIRPGERVLCHTIGQMEFVRSLGGTADASYRMNVFNSRCAEESARLTDGTVILSPELNIAALRDIIRRVPRCGAVVYGKLPVMYTVRCMIRGGDCPKGGRGGQTGEIRESGQCRHILTDRLGMKFPVIGGRDCANTVYNSVPLWMADREDVLRRAGIDVRMFVFADESGEEVRRVLEAHRTEGAPDSGARRLR